jgi:hypothetical protein
MRCLIFLAAACVFAAPAPVPDVLLEQARAAPPEFAADALLRLAESGKRTPEKRIALMEEAFRLAQSAHFQMPYRSFRNGTDSREATQSQAYRMRLDALSLETRAVAALVPLDPAKARQYFEEIRVPQLPALTCSDNLIPEAGSFYQVLGTIVQNTFSRADREKEEHLNFLLGYVARITSPVQLAPVARLIRSVTLTPAQQDAVLGAFNGILANMESPTRAFEATLPELQAALSDEMQPAFAKYASRARTTNSFCKDADIQVNAYWQSPESKAMFEQARGRKPDLLQQVSSWSGPFEEKSLVYLAVLDAASGPDFDPALAAFVEYLRGASLQQQSPVEWFLPARTLYDRLRDRGSPEAERVLAAYRESGNPILALFSAMEANFGSKLPPWVPASP